MGHNRKITYMFCTHKGLSAFFDIYRKGDYTAKYGNMQQGENSMTACFGYHTAAPVLARSRSREGASGIAVRADRYNDSMTAIV